MLRLRSDKPTLVDELGRFNDPNPSRLNLVRRLGLRPSVPRGKFAAHSAEVCAFLARHRDTAMLEVFRGAVTQPGAGRTGGMGSERVARDTSCRVHWFSDFVRKREGRLMVRSRAAP